MTGPDFIQIARECFDPLIKTGFETEETSRGRGEVHLKLLRGGITIDLGYEPFGPPWCHITENQAWREAKVNIGNEAGQALATGTKTEEAVAKHTEEVRAWCVATCNALRVQRGIGC
jgi:hypothetical protein